MDIARRIDCFTREIVGRVRVVVTFRSEDVYSRWTLSG